VRTRHTRRQGVPVDGTFAAVLRAYENSPQFPQHRGTADNYRRVIRWAESVLGRYSTTDTVNGIRPKLVLVALDQLAATPGQQYNARAVLGTIDRWAVPRELLLQSITFGVKIAGKIGGHEPWTDGQVALGQQHASPALARVITIAVNTGQRGSDIVRMRLTDISEERHPITGRVYPGINVVQKKTGLRLWVPFTDEMAAAIEGWRREIRPPWLLVTQPDGTPFDRISPAWQAERRRNAALAPLKEAGLVIHGLRGTCVVRLRKAGASPLQIGNMIGMSEPMVARYSRLADQIDMGLAAVHHLNTRTTREPTRSDTTASEPKPLGNIGRTI
jgi:hypothetical protein